MFSQAATEAAHAVDPKPVAGWLDDLLGDDPAARRTAGDVLWLMHLGTLPTPADPDRVGEPAMRQFAAEVRRCLDDPGRRGRAYERAAAICLADADLHRRKMAVEFNAQQKRQDEQFDRVAKRLNARLDAAPAEQRDVIRRRIDRALEASFDRDLRRTAAAEALGETSGNDKVMAGQVLEANAARLVVERPDLVRRLRADRYTRRHPAARILEAAGPAAAAGFLDELLAEVAAAEGWDEPGFEPRVLAAVGRGDSRTVPALLALARGRDRAAGFSKSTIGELGPDAATPEVAALYRDLADGGDPRGSLALIPALPDKGEATGRLLTMTRGDQYEAGGAILAMAKLAPHDADRVVPRLIELFDEFEEYDPDYSYEGEHERVCHALAAYGPLATPAAGRVGDYLRQWHDDPADRDFPRDGFRALAAIGPAAAGLLPLLWAIRRRDDEPGEPEDELDPELSPLDAAIVALGGGAG